ncbi:MAG TPA: hypothetical protein PLM04_00410 [Paludibacteraceae bacterium]|jgi:hypothetical protein|nr:hypothetical protein [Paludibacteraceae bacterium]
MNIIFRHVGSIRPLKNKLYSDENGQSQSDGSMRGITGKGMSRV